MPTNLPVKPKRTTDLFVLFAIFVGLSFLVIEIINPAPMDSLANSIAAP